MIRSNDKWWLWIDFDPISTGFTLIMIDIDRYGFSIELCNIFLSLGWNHSKMPTTYSWTCDYCGEEHWSLVKPPNFDKFKNCNCKPVGMC